MHDTCEGTTIRIEQMHPRDTFRPKILNQIAFFIIYWTTCFHGEGVLHMQHFGQIWWFFKGCTLLICSKKSTFSQNFFLLQKVTKIIFLAKKRKNIFSIFFEKMKILNFCIRGDHMMKICRPEPKFKVPPFEKNQFFIKKIFFSKIVSLSHLWCF